MPTSTFEHIGTVTLASSGAIDITGIPSTYTDLIIKGQLRAAGGTAPVENCSYTFNNTGSGLYSDMRMIGYGTDSWSSSSEWSLDNHYIGAIQGPTSAVANGYTPFEIKVSQYANTNVWKFSLASWGTYTYEAGYRAGNFQSTSAINRFTMFCGGGGSFFTGSSVTIWGIKAE